MGVIPLERLVQRHYLKEDISQSKVAIYLAICFCIAFGFGDYWNFGFGSKLTLTIAFRTLFLLFSIIAVLSLDKLKSTDQHNKIMLGWCMLLIGLVLCVNYLRQPSNLNFTYLDLLICLALYLVLPNSLLQKVFIVASLSLGDFIIIILYKKPLDHITLATILTCYIVANVLGIFFSKRLNQFRQNHFRALLQEQEIRQELERVAYLDYLTGAYNRRKFFELGEAEFYRFKRYQSSFSLLMLDLDNFKLLNDRFGHDAGDVFLIEFAKAIAQNLRTGDIMGRLGGEEFALILPETSLNLARQAAGRIISLCESVKVPYQSWFLYTTVSIGVTEVTDNDQSFNDTIKRADSALYQAKRAGRNRMAQQ